MKIILTLLAIVTICSACEVSQWESRIQADLLYFRAQGGITRGHLGRAEYVMNLTQGYVLKIVNNSLYFRPLGENVLKPKSVHAKQPFLLLLVKALCRFKFPDVEFVLSHDCRRGAVYLKEGAPIFSYAKDPFWEHDLMYPYWNMLWPASKRREYKESEVPWEHKKGQAIWRGAPTGGKTNAYNWQKLPRANMIKLCNTVTQLCDAGFYTLVGHNKLPDNITLRNRVMRRDLPKYKYLILVDGNTVPSSRSHDMMLTKSLILKQESPLIEFFYDDLEAYVHYVPVSFHMSTLPEALRWAHQNDAWAAQIANTAYQYAVDNFVDEKIACYWYRLLTQYADLQRYQPTIQADDNKLICPQRVWSYLVSNMDYRCDFFENNL